MGGHELRKKTSKGSVKSEMANVQISYIKILTRGQHNNVVL